MKHHPFKAVSPRAASAAALLSALALSSGCVVAERPAPVVYTTPAYPTPPPAYPAYPAPEEVTVDTDPPPPLVEYVGVSPGPGFFWIGGYYHWTGHRWAWYRGHYERPPHPGARWFAARYEVRGGRRVYIHGYWR